MAISERSPMDGCIKLCFFVEISFTEPFSRQSRWGMAVVEYEKNGKSDNR